MSQFDLKPDIRMTPTIGLLHSMVTYNYERLKRLVQGLTQDQIDYRGPDNDLNSISQLLRHLSVVDLHWVYRLQSLEIPKDYIAKYGPMYDSDGKLPYVKDIPLKTLIEQYDLIQEMFREVCMKLSDDDLLKDVPFENGHSSTVRWGIWHVADHSRHHYANIVHLKKRMC